MGISTRTRARKSDSSTAQQLFSESAAATLNTSNEAVAQMDNKEEVMPPSDSADEADNSLGGAVEAPVQNTESNSQSGSTGDSVSIPASNIRQFKEAVVNTSKLLKVFSDQEKELSKAKLEISKCHEEAKRLHASYQGLQHDADSRSRELSRSNAELENARSLLVLREKELSRVRGLKEDLEAKIVELKLAEPVVSHNVPPKSPNTLLLDEIEKLKKELEAKEGSLKSLRISRDSIRSSTKAEIMSIQARYAREQKEMVERQNAEITGHRQGLAAKEAELEQEQERLMQLEMDLSMRSTQLEDQAAELKASLDDMTSKHEAACEVIKRLEGQAKTRSTDHRSEIAKLNRVCKRDEKRIAELESAFEKAKAQAKENAKAAQETAKMRGRSRPRSTATAAEAVSAATEEVANMDIEELREEVATLRVDAVHKDETIRKLGVMVEELERKQNPEGRRPRAKVAAMQTEIDELKAELDVRTKKMEALEKAMCFSESAQSNISGISRNGGVGPVAEQASAFAQLELKIIALETDIKERDGKIELLNKELKEAQEMKNERPMRLRHSSVGLSPSSNQSSAAAATTLGAASTTTHVQQTAFGRSTASGVFESPLAGKRRGSSRAVSRAPNDPSESLYVEIADLRAKVGKLKQEKGALLELITEQQVTIHQLRNGSSLKQSKQKTLASIQGASKQEELQTAGTNVYSETVERLLKDRRISGVNRAKRFFSHLQKAPHALHKALLQMHDGDVPLIDAAEFAKVLVPFVASLATKVGADSRVQPSEHEYRSLFSGNEDVADPGLLSHTAIHGLYKTEVDIAASIWIVSIKNSQGQFFNGLMQLLAQKTISPSTRSVAAVCSLARIFASLCLLAADVQRARVMLCDLLMDAVDSPHTLPVLSNVLAVCPDALRMPQESESNHEADEGAEDRSALRLVVRVFQAIASGIHDLYSEEHGKAEADALYAIMVERCGWRRPSNAEYADKIFVETSDKLASLKHSSCSYPVVMCAYNLLAPYVVPAQAT
ncbi:hypothetical protein GGH99_004858 [Coemansia sp. RSA 1285]|nr:hypothetical protein GGH99_004858 [Coemansia sp. RSA 1285]